MNHDNVGTNAAIWRRDPLRFFTDVLTLEDGSSYGANLDSWQRDDFEAAFNNPQRHIWWERPRGHSKTADAAALALHHILSGQGRRAFVGAVDRDQAALIAETIGGFVHRSELLSNSLEVSRYRVVAPTTGSSLQVLAADAASSWGLRPSLLVLDELASWRGTGAESFFESLVSALGKVKGARALVASTAGWDRHSLCWRLREQAQVDPSWLFTHQGQCASWVTEDFLEQQRRLLPPHVFTMLHLNEWTEAGGAFLTWPEIDAVFRREEQRGPSDGSFYLGLDIGITHDRTAIGIVRAGGDPLHAHIERIEISQGSPEQRVQLTEIEARVLELVQRYRPRKVVIDPFQGLLLSERLRHRGITVEEFSFTPASRTRLFDELLQLIRQRRLTSIEDSTLKEELEGLRWSDQRGILRVDHQAGQHDDAVVAIGLACHAAIATATRAPGAIEVWVAGGRRTTQYGWRTGIG